MPNKIELPPDTAAAVKLKKLYGWLKVAFGVLLIVIIILLLLRGCGEKENVLEPDYEQLPPEQNAIAIPDEKPADTPPPQASGGSVELVYSDQITVDTASGRVGLFYQNPSSSTHNVVVQVTIPRGDSEYLVAQSGVLEPGFMLTDLTLAEDLALSPGGYDGLIRLLFYHPESGERAIVDTNIPVYISVS